MALPASLIIPIPVPSETRNLINPPGAKICITNIPDRTGGAMTTSKSLLATLDPQQRAAAEAPEGPVLILGGPGVGKTRTILARVEALLRKWYAAPDHNLRRPRHQVRRGHAPATCGTFPDRRCSVGQVRFSTMELCALDSLRGGGLESLRTLAGAQGAGDQPPKD